jgi:hypothetical protein
VSLHPLLNSACGWRPQGGVDALLDLIECCPRILLPSAVGCLADMLANANVKPYVKVWKSDRTGCSAASLLLRLWREDQEAKSRDLSSGTADMSATARVVAGLMGKVTGATSKSLASTSPADAVLAFDRLRQALKAAKVRSRQSVLRVFDCILDDVARVSRVYSLQMWKKVVKSKPGSTIKSRVLADDIQPKVRGLFTGCDHRPGLFASLWALTVGGRCRCRSLRCCLRLDSTRLRTRSLETLTT